MTTIGSMDQARREILSHLACARRRRRERERVLRLMRLTDALVDELERLNLAGVQRVGGEWRPRLASLFSVLPFRYVPWLRAHPSPTEVLDVLFDIQARLLDLKRRQSVLPARPRRLARWPVHAHREG